MTMSFSIVKKRKTLGSQEIVDIYVPCKIILLIHRFNVLVVYFWHGAWGDL
jgi:hypothetical protein